MPDEIKAIVKGFVDEVQSKRDVGAIDRFFSQDFVNHTEMPGIPSNLDGVKQFHGMFFAAFPDVTATIHTQVAEGDKVVTHKTFNGTHQGDFMGIPATGKKIAFEVIDIVTITGGKITDHWVVADQMSLMQQLGVIPAH